MCKSILSLAVCDVIILLLAFLCLVAGSSAQYCGTGLLSCGAYGCYNASTATCQQGGEGLVMCNNVDGKVYSACGTSCYNPSSYSCCNNQLVQIPPPYGFQCVNATQAPTSGPATSSPTSPSATVGPVPGTQLCTSSSCAAGLQCCPGNPAVSCYNSSDYVCLNNDAGQSFICANPAANPSICDVYCIYPSVSICCNGEILQVGSSCTAPSTVSTTATVAPPVFYALGAHNASASAVYNYYYYWTTQSSVTYLGAGDAALTEPLVYYGNYGQTIASGLVLVYDDPTVAVANNAILVITWFGSANQVESAFNVIQTNCNDSSYSTCSADSLSCYPTNAYGDIKICPCGGDCAMLQTFVVSYAGLDVPATNGGSSFDGPLYVETTEIKLGDVSLPLTITLTTLSPVFTHFKASIKSAVLNYN